MKSRNINNRKECSQLFCNDPATRKVKFKKDPILDLEQEIVFFCKKHAKQKKENSDLRTMWVARI